MPVGFALVWQVTLHTFGLVQSKLFPVYFYCLLGSNFVSLAVYAVYHPRELLDWHESVQVKHHTCTYAHTNKMIHIYVFERQTSMYFNHNI